MSQILRATAAQYDSQIKQLDRQIAELQNKRNDVDAARKAIEPAIAELDTPAPAEQPEVKPQSVAPDTKKAARS